ncbi:MAG: hypothetical protein ACRD5M_14665 [Candidatus Acidiferrales bacterium]
MRKQTLAVAIVMAISLVATGRCLARPRVLTAHIPFTFQVGTTRMPAGQYQIESVITGAGTLQVIRRVDGGTAIRLSTIAIEARSENSNAKLVFHHAGNEYFLSQILNGDGTGQQLFESKPEKEAARNGSVTEVALAVR